MKVAGVFTFAHTCCGTTIAPFSVVAMNCESTVFNFSTTAYLPLALIEAMLESGRVKPMMSITFDWAAVPPLSE